MIKPGLAGPLTVLLLFAASAVQGHEIRRLGDDRVSGEPRVDHLYSCQQQFDPNAPGASGPFPWIQGQRYDPRRKPVIGGRQSWPNAQIAITREGNWRLIVSNNLPQHPTGIFPIRTSDQAYQFDRNPNAIREQRIRLKLPFAPQAAPAPSCVPMGLIGFTVVGGALYNAMDARGRDAPAYEMMDLCGGQPQQEGQYHYHDNAPCLPNGRDANGHSELIGYALDGFGIYGAFDIDGRPITNRELDACHGHVGPVLRDGRIQEIFHYHLNDEYPYSVGCFHGTPVRVSPDIRLPKREGRPDPLLPVARELGVEVGALREAIGPPPPNFRRAARILGIDAQRLREAFRRRPPPQ